MPSGHPTPAPTRALISRLRAQGVSSPRIAALTGIGESTVRLIAPPPARVDNAPLREAFEASGRSAASVAKQIGWTEACADHRGQRVAAWRRGDSSRLRRALGLRPDHTTHNGRHYVNTRKTTSIDTALLIADALGLDPVDVGI